MQILKPGERKSIQNQRVTLIPGDEKEQEVVRRIFREFTSAGKNAEQIAENLNEDDILSPTGRKWRRNAICNILTNEVYICTNISTW